MRTFILALTVLALILAALTLAGVYLTGKADALTEAAKALPEESASNSTQSSGFYTAARNFSEIWSSTKKTIHFIIGHKEADRIEETFIDLQVRYLLRDNAGYMSARAKLLHEIEQLAESETFSFDTVT